MKTIGVGEAESRFDELLDWVEAGEDVVITRCGKVVARLVPPGTAFGRGRGRGAAQRIRAMRRGVTLGGIAIEDMVSEGRL
ncbi:type II toxin-antitoxin system Phd/YefM family antitoxin [Rhodopila globiformis]|uniref:Antitoxin n=1 Tax=Rhodopila globiformis TaxID=1071 RepID=A0A2S6MZS3_RHOGL|nr:type II toxin-antitoxin system prevent-host-death family antitoxin [Rhodopila globiformis]PPQ27850.1 hypothetical protein CCS01_25915 [Rhodopila globiformis]